jgi:hypothetical protein
MTHWGAFTDEGLSVIGIGEQLPIGFAIQQSSGGRSQPQGCSACIESLAKSLWRGFIHWVS